MDGSESTTISRGFVENILSHISEKPWSDYVAADYTVEQWHTSCLIHQHDGSPTSKGECKLPVRTPSGAVSRNGVYAAAAALGGARGGVNASEDEKATAAHALIRLYKELDKEPPPALLSHSVDNILAHIGTTGMKWGVRKSRTGDIKPRATLSRSDRRGVALTREAKLSDPFYSEVYKRSASRIRQGTRQLNNNPKFMGKDFKVDSINRRSYYDAYSKMVTNQLNATVGSKSINPFRRLGMPTKRLELHFDYNVRKELSPRVTIRPADTRSGTKDLSIKKKEIRDSVKHASENVVDAIEEIEVFLITDEKGYILDLDVPGENDDALIQQNSPVDNVLIHFGKLGMKWGRRTRSTSEGTNDSDRAVTVYSRPGKGVIKTKGGQDRLVSEDAKKAAVSKQIVRKSGMDALSNDQLRDLNNRMSLEANYSKAIIPPSKQKSAGRKFAEKVVKKEFDSLASGKPGPIALGLMAVAGYGVKRKLDKGKQSQNDDTMTKLLKGNQEKKKKGSDSASDFLKSSGSKKMGEERNAFNAWAKKNQSNKATPPWGPPKGPRYADWGPPKGDRTPGPFDVVKVFMPERTMQTAISSIPHNPGTDLGSFKPASWK